LALTFDTVAIVEAWRPEGSGVSEVDNSPERAKRTNWVAIIGGAAITTILGLLGTWAYSSITSQSTELSFEVTEAPPLFGTLEDSRIYFLRIANSGDRPIDSVQAAVEFSDGVEITESDITGPAALEQSSDIEVVGSTSTVRVPAMNSGDSVQISYLVSKADSQSVSTPTVDVRADGVTGRPRLAEEDDESGPALFAMLASLLAGVSLAGAAVASRLTLSRARSVDGAVRISTPQVRNPRGVVLAWACLTHGATSLAEHYLTHARAERWWIEADFLAALALSDDDRLSAREAILVLREVLKSDGIPEYSRAVYLCNIAVLHHKSGDDQEAKLALAEARALHAGTVERRSASGKLDLPVEMIGP
jgi:hypothetical protein